jgi:hypothetical protein
MARHLPNLELPDPEIDDRDRATSAGSPKPAATSEADQTGTEPPHVREALRAIIRLLARQTAREHMAQGE